jgi:hypothetical protein
MDKDRILAVINSAAIHAAQESARLIRESGVVLPEELETAVKAVDIYVLTLLEDSAVDLLSAS